MQEALPLPYLICLLKIRPDLGLINNEYSLFLKRTTIINDEECIALILFRLVAFFINIS
ncbi:hypothetical protein CFS9_43030 [Flavobacterium sp. CFS9]|uniref:Uncharacterized protein n=1 Tax=Flavobacterium sp. CFS9 TaxID=3143118 RepID=A0AAT9H805_9FLAO